MTQLEYAEFNPPPQLRAFVRCVWRLTAPRADHQLPAEPIIPDGCVEMVVNCGDVMHRFHANGIIEHQPRRLLAGQLTHALAVAPSGRTDLWGIRFHPWSAAAFLGVGGSELREQMLSMDVSPTLDAILARVQDSAALDDNSRLQLLFAELTRYLPRVRAYDARLSDVASLAAAGQQTSVRAIAQEVGLGVRRVQGLFVDAIGMSPKTLMRISRFQRALALARRHPAMSWGRIAVETGYYDHAHFVHDAQAIAGCSPTDLVRRAGSITEAFILE